MPDLYLAIDFGSSATKIAYRLNAEHSEQKLEVEMLPSDIEAIEKKHLDQYLEAQKETIRLKSISESAEIWIEAKGQLYAVGELAKNFEPINRIKDVKYEWAAYKALAMLGYALSQSRQRLGLKKKKVYKIQLAVLLPWDEFPDKNRFKSFVEKLLATASYRGNSLSVQLDSFSVRQEGFGLFHLYRNLESSPDINGLAILMLGHRNVSVLYFQDNQLQSGASPRLGFHQVIDGIINQISWLDEAKLIEAMGLCWSKIKQRQNFFQIEEIPKSHLGGIQVRHKEESFRHFLVTLKYPNWKEMESIQDLARAKDPDLREREIEDIDSAINKALEEYWESLRKWFFETFNQPCQKLLLSGGASYWVLPKWLSICQQGILMNINSAKYLPRVNTWVRVQWVYLSERVEKESYSRQNFHLPSRQTYWYNQLEVLDHSLLTKLLHDYINFSLRRIWWSASSTQLEQERVADVIGLGAYLLERGKNG